MLWRKPLKQKIADVLYRKAHRPAEPGQQTHWNWPQVTFMRTRLHLLRKANRRIGGK
jgi:hypothetical protein